MSWRRLLAAGTFVTLLALAAGGGLELWRFGPTDERAGAKVEAHVRRRFDAMIGVLSRVAKNVAEDPAARAGLTANDGARALFDLLDRHLADIDDEQIAVTIYDALGDARAWSGRPSDILVRGPQPYFVTPSALGWRLVHAVPIAGPDARAGSVAVEHVLTPAPAPTIAFAPALLETPLGPASLRTRLEIPDDRPGPGVFIVRDPTGAPLVEATVSPVTLRQARARWRYRVVAIALVVVSATILLLIGPALDRRIRAHPRVARRATAAALALLLAGAATLAGAIWLFERRRPSQAVMLVLGAATAAAIAAILAAPIAQLRLHLRGRRRLFTGAPLRFVVMQLAAGVALAAILVAFERVLSSVVDPATVDLRHFSLHPWSAQRLMLLCGMLAVHVAALWTGTLVLSAALAPWRVPSGALAVRVAAAALWLAPAVAVAAVAESRATPLPPWGVMASAAAATVAALAGRAVVIWYRHATVAARILTLAVAFVVPALLLYPSIEFFTGRAMRRLIAERYAVEALNHPQELQARLSEALGEIDAQARLPTLVSDSAALPPTGPRPTEAFLVWRQTTLMRSRLTSAVELYDRHNTLISRFALGLPEYTGAAQAPATLSGCRWDVFGEAAPFGSEERRLLHAERKICTSGAGAEPEPVGAIVVHLALDYGTLPFITSQSPYIEVFRPAGSEVPGEGTTPTHVETVIYGWGLGPIFISGRTAWPITDELFQRIYQAREPFWTEIKQGGETFRVYFANDRPAIFALGYRAPTLFDDLVHLAELTTLAATVYALVLFGTGIFTRLSRSRPRIGRALLREIRASFYRKLFLAFVLASIIPVLTLALVIREYFARQLREDVQDEASRTAAVAQRVVQESDVLQRSSAEGPSMASDDVMVWISQLIDQDVNIFRGPRLLATSERDLFASGLLPERTPADVYRAIALQRMPAFVGEDRIGSFPYMVAAAPIRAEGEDDILTVPLTNRQREIEREIDELDRGVHLASLFFILLGAGIGLSMAERIADPVRRLTRATRQIARGDFDARIAVRSADELRRLVDAFNSMAAELKAQRAQLERTHRLEAWAEMARQVAHEIKNPLTPIQLSAEHLRRVHADRGEPLGEVLEGCVTSILGQVRLLRQISSEFSSFASAPTARRAPVDVPQLDAEVVDPYRTGLEGRVEIVNRVTAPLPPVHVDRTLIARALANIVENALHAMPGRGVLTLDGGVRDGFVVVTVRDSGVGMDDEALARVFEPYFSTKTTGTGLGLPIALRNVELNGGTLDVESAKGAGTIVRMKLPIQDGAASGQSPGR